ncbi:UDP-N-acetylmuramate:L-alanyl-gamma-D-glutamyl-meso-diaminopimelate ligase [uncultured Pseudoteredinibacter sp.]|uniref:UDP-N-acetylmuramate:L-alanyl-gamma-D-glutamyl- meso-diaminopimelate ligase n=1 Tax=uncultured Pseudoteredinibacter sp. TaxID=1641701 RepID=UPI002602B9D6|nr:UDP-N-acetylmuramate:L-alanyl-gamma-D-glutamyl-meso-diaminopimelate ligase [uncultured Pseudoteredinibacter sp.]
MHIHFLGICGTFMGSLAQLAKALGHQVSGSDANVYPPMSTQLEQAGITLHEGYDSDVLNPAPDLVIIGNAMSRGNPAVEYVLDKRLPYCSGPEWLCNHVLQSRWVLAVSGTHGKTTTSSMLAWILEFAGMSPGFLIGGVPANFPVSARLGGSDFFVIEADEYDSAFFDKRSKFVHYRPQTLVINNLEFDHADIFDSLEDIQKQFHHVVRTVPSVGQVIYPSDVPAVEEVLGMGCWSETQSLGGDWKLLACNADGSQFTLQDPQGQQAVVEWGLNGQHNVANAMAAIAAARHVGVELGHAAEALGQFAGVKRRLENLGEVAGITVYDDFAHHPTAIATTLEGLRNKLGGKRIVAVLEPRSNTMKLGVHKETLFQSCIKADQVFCLQPPGMDWRLEDYASSVADSLFVADSIDHLLQQLLSSLKRGDHVVLMSNGGFGGLHQRLLNALKERGVG